MNLPFPPWSWTGHVPFDQHRNFHPVPVDAPPHTMDASRNTRYALRSSSSWDMVNAPARRVKSNQCRRPWSLPFSISLAAQERSAQRSPRSVPDLGQSSDGDRRAIGNGLKRAQPQMCSRGRKRKAARTSHGFVPLVRATESFLASVLPGSASFAHQIIRHKFWTVPDETRLRASWTADDTAALLAPSPSSSASEAAVWAAMQSLFGTSPSDLFRYGLRRDQDDDPDDSLGFWQRLLVLLPHPFWRGDSAVLRYALQLAVLRRVGGPGTHPWPVGAAHQDARGASGQSFLAWTRTSPSQEPDALGVRKDVAHACEFMELTRIQHDPVLQHLSFALGLSKRGKPAQVPQWAAAAGVCARLGQQRTSRAASRLSVSARFLFVVCAADLASLTKAVDQVVAWKKHYEMVEQGIRKGPDCSVDACFALWLAQNRAEAHAETLLSHTLLHNKRLAVLSERREALIRYRMALANMQLRSSLPSHHPGERWTLPDIPPADPYPEFPLWQFLTPAQLVVLNGHLTTTASTRRWLQLHVADASFSSTLLDLFLGLAPRLDEQAGASAPTWYQRVHHHPAGCVFGLAAGQSCTSLFSPRIRPPFVFYGQAGALAVSARRFQTVMATLDAEKTLDRVHSLPARHDTDRKNKHLSESGDLDPFKQGAKWHGHVYV